jgi:phage shock protein A
MSLKLWNRITTLLKADAHGVVESLEDRERLLKQYLREAELELDRKRAQFEALRDEEARSAESLARREEENRALDEDIALALAGGKEDLARFAIRRLLPRRNEAKVLAARLVTLEKESQALGERLAEQEQKFEALRTRVRAELARATELDPPGGWLAEPAVADEEVELELMRRRGAREGERS